MTGMLIRRFLALVLSALALLHTAPALANLDIGAAAPTFTLKDTFGNTVGLENFRGRTVVLEWTNHDCPYVHKHYSAGNMQSQQKAARDAGVVWLSIISSAPGKQGYLTAAEADRINRSRDAAPHAILLDPKGSVGRLYQARTTPHMFIIDGDGILRYKGGIDSIPSSSAGDIDGAKQYVKVALEEMAAGKTITDSVTRPYGCSVKY
ncbi:MAG: redoxin domain-containing protein [Gammaproteobacteria bacterium]